MQDEWFNDPDTVQAQVGLIQDPHTCADEKDLRRCNICFEKFLISQMDAAGCGHYFCSQCWTGYVHTAIESGPASLDLRCPEPSCSAVVPESIVSSACDDTHLSRYREFGFRSFVDDNKRMAWCTAPNCTAAAEAIIDIPREALDVQCSCGNAFCFHCKEEAHRPVDCKTVRRWLIKNSAESENMTWILANTKPCPKCTRPIEKNQGCMHMTCSQCQHEFCWLCQGPWTEHGERTGGFYTCNTYKRRQEAGEIDEAEEQRSHARASLERYMHYWQRWAEHDKARRTAIKQMSVWENEQLEALAERTATPTSQLRFVLDAWKEVVSCRRILKWTYAVGYYSFDDHEANKLSSRADKERQTAHKQFFEFTQQDAENALERMNDKVENKLPKFLKDAIDQGNDSTKTVDPAAWAGFREELIGLTDVTRNHFAKLVDFLEKGMERGLAEFQQGDDDLELFNGNEAVEEDGGRQHSKEATPRTVQTRRSARLMAKGGGG